MLPPSSASHPPTILENVNIKKPSAVLLSRLGIHTIIDHNLGILSKLGLCFALIEVPIKRG
jgi:hypothetical protein